MRTCLTFVSRVEPPIAIRRGTRDLRLVIVLFAILAAGGVTGAYGQPSRHSNPSPMAEPNGLEPLNQSRERIDRGLVSVDESTARVTLAADPPSFSLRVDTTGAQVTARISVQVLSAEGKVLVNNAVSKTIARGGLQCAVPLPGLVELRSLDCMDLAWLRIRYQIEPDSSGQRPIVGVLSLSAVTPELFQLAPSALNRGGEPGGEVFARVVATHPTTHLPQQGVTVEAELVLAEGDKEIVIKAAEPAATDDLGCANLLFLIPETSPNDPGWTLRAVGRLGGLKSVGESTIYLQRSVWAYLTADKPIYQPGQTLRARVVALERGDRPVAGLDLSVVVWILTTTNGCAPGSLPLNSESRPSIGPSRTTSD